MPDSDDLRVFIREIVARHERVWREQAQILWKAIADLEALRSETNELRSETNELREESRAQTRALLHVLDRLENGGAAA